MKKIYLCLIAALAFHSFSYTQWTTLYEGGAGTSNNLSVGNWEYRFFFSPGGNVNEPHTMFGTSGGINNGARLFYYTDDFGIGTAGIQKRIPGMENYASLRIYIESDLPDSIGSMTYAKMDSSEFMDNFGTPLWHEFATDHIGDTIEFSNTEGNNVIYLFANLLRGDSVSFRIHYVRIEADTTQFNQLYVNGEIGLYAYTSGDQLYIQANNQEIGYSVELYNSSGARIMQTSTQGTQSIPVHYETGIYYANIITESGNTKQFKVFIE